MEIEYIFAQKGKESDFISRERNWNPRYMVSYSFSATGTQPKHFFFSISAYLRYLVALMATMAKHFTFAAFFTSSHLFYRWKCTVLPPYRGPDCLNAAQGSKVKNSCSADAGLRRPWKFRVANVFLHQHFQALKGLLTALPNVSQSLEDQVSQHLAHSSSLSHCTK